MTSALAGSRTWSRRRWGVLVALIFTVQVALIFALGEASAVRRRAAPPGFTLKLAGNGSAELLALRDPTLFVLPRQPGVVKATGLSAPHPEARAVVWPEPTNHSPPELDQPGAAFTRFAASNAFDTVRLPVTPPPQLTLPALPSPPVPTAQSAVRLEGGLAQRRLAAPLELPLQTNRDILRDSVVRLILGADGAPRSVALLSGSGSAEADGLALEQARGARFEPLSPSAGHPNPGAAADLNSGRMVFLWHTVPLLVTNPPPAKP